MIAATRQMGAGRKVEDVAREAGVSTHTVYAWKARFGGGDGNELVGNNAIAGRKQSIVQACS
jgi:transposase-like protein